MLLLRARSSIIFPKIDFPEFILLSTLSLLYYFTPLCAYTWLHQCFPNCGSYILPLQVVKSIQRVSISIFGKLEHSRKYQNALHIEIKYCFVKHTYFVKFNLYTQSLKAICCTMPWNIWFIQAVFPWSSYLRRSFLSLQVHF